MFILLYNLVLFVLMSILSVSSVSRDCIERELCSGSENASHAIVGSAWLALAGLSIVLGWKGRLPGCRPRSDGPIDDSL